MKRKNVLLLIAAAAVLILAFGLYSLLKGDEYKVSENELALYIHLDTKEDIGLVVYDYTMDGRQLGGGISNADRSMLKHGEVIINVWDRTEPEMNWAPGTVNLVMYFRVITEYCDPNFENIYPEELTVRLDPISWTASFGKAYDVHIIGDKTNGYTATVADHAE